MQNDRAFECSVCGKCEYEDKLAKQVCVDCASKAEEVFVLLADGDGTLHLIWRPIGVAVRSEEEAKRFCAQEKFGHDRTYTKLKVFGTWADALEHIKKEYEKC